MRASGAAKALTVLAALSTFVWFFGHDELHLALAVVLVAALVADAVLARWALAKVEIRLRAPLDAPAGVPSRWDLDIRGWRRPVAVRPLIVSTFTDQLIDAPGPAILAWPAMGRSTVPFVVFDTTANGPLGLTTAGRREVQRFDEPMHVGPAPIDTDVRWPRPRPSGFGPVEGAPVGDELFRSIRPYRRGDDRRRVHWKATAHHGQLMVRELDGTGAVLIQIVVELEQLAAERTAGIAASVALEALRRGWQVELVTVEGEPLGLASPGRVFGSAPSVVRPSAASLRTVTAPVRRPHDVHRRLAAATWGRPIAPRPAGRSGQGCHIGSAGVTWS